MSHRSQPQQAGKYAPLPGAAFCNLARSLALVLGLLLALLPPAARAAVNVDYLDASGTLLTAPTATDITSADCGTTLASGWYVVSSDVSCAATITIGGNVNLILANGHSLSVTPGAGAAINVTTVNSLSIYAQSADPAAMGSLSATGAANGGGISCNSATGNITINGGAVTANGGSGRAGIGGAACPITINGGVVTANGGSNSAGIGGAGGNSGGTITINGGSVTATGGDSGAGIGGGSNSSGGAGGTITINGGSVTAIGGHEAAGIGGGLGRAGGTITITGGTVIATGGDSGGAGIGGGSSIDVSIVSGASGDITISGDANVTATGGDGYGGFGSDIGGGAGIGSGGSDTSAGGVGAIGISTTGAVSATGGGPGASADGGADIGTGGSPANAGAQTMVLLTATAGTNGSLAPAGTVGVAMHGSQGFTATPDTGFWASITDDGVDVTDQLSANTYTLTGVTASHAIAVTFVAKADPAVALSGAAPSGVYGAVGAQGVTVAVTGSYGDLLTVTCTINGTTHTATRTGDGDVTLDFTAAELNALAAGSYPITVATAATLRNNAVAATQTGALQIDKAQPVPPTGLAAPIGKTLADVPLPGGWTWDEALTTPVGGVGAQAHAASYVDATGNYVDAANVQLSIEVRSVEAAPIPTLGDAGLVLLALLLAGVAVVRTRRVWR